MGHTSLRLRFGQEAQKAGFSAYGFANLPETWDAEQGLRDFISAGYHGDMMWMQDTLDRRAHPKAMWPEAKSAIVLGMNYGPAHDPLTELGQSQNAYISVYARGDDYHDVIKGRLKGLAGWWAKEVSAQVKVFVDTAPLMEKPLAQLAGLGFQGKHTNLVSRQLGSWLFLGTILTDQALGDTDAAEGNHCGTCTACLDICPTKAFVAPFQLDARACLSYLTIEHKGPWPLKYRAAMGNRIYGCDDCLAVCPWNKFAESASEVRLEARSGLSEIKLIDLLRMDEAQFRTHFAKNPIKRIGHARFLRNAAYGLGNHIREHRDQDAIQSLIDRLGHEAALVRGACVWALSQGMSVAEFAALREAHYPKETDLDVRCEWEGCAP